MSNKNTIYLNISGHLSKEIKGLFENKNENRKRKRELKNPY